MNTPNLTPRWRLPRSGLLCALLAAVTAAAFAPVLGSQFILCDDPMYVTDNPRVLGGLSLDNVVWAFGAGAASNWHPLTWLSHMLDVQLFGLTPGWHHLTSLLLHVANTLLLFRLLENLTGAPWRSAMVAALFGAHPLHVESVAWVAERKDVLSTLFFLLTLMAYVRYVRGAKRDYLLSLGLFTLGLMSKPMLVTLPFVLMLLDYWPLGRLGFEPQPGLLRRLRPLLVEKVPFFCLALGSCTVTYLVQHASHATTAVLPLAPRLANAVASYLKYLGKTFWPARLAAYYPHPDTRYPLSHQWPAWCIAAGALLLAALTWLAWRRLRRQPWLAVGWFWFLGTLVPVIGLVQVGGQAMADRYTYIPLIGIFISVVWSAAEALGGRPAGQPALATAGVAVIAACVLATQHQVEFWRDDSALFQHALDVTTDNFMAHMFLGDWLRTHGRATEAIPHFKAAIQEAPELPDGYYTLAVAEALQGQRKVAAELFRTALSMAPWDSRTHNAYGYLLWEMDRHAEAEAQYLEALRLNPEYPEALVHLGLALFERGDLKGATARFTAAVYLRPGYTPALGRLAECLLRQGRLAEAEARYRDCVQLCPTNAEMRINLGGVLWREGRGDDALAEYAAAAKLDPQSALAHFNLGTVLSARGMFAPAADQFTAAVHLKPDYFEALSGLGRALAGQGKFNQAQAAFREAAQLCPTNAALRVYLGNALMMAGKTNEAIQVFTAALRLDPGLVRENVQAGKSMAEKGLLNAALARFNTALWLEPDNPDAHQNLALLLERQGRINDARWHFQEAARLRRQEDPHP